MILPPCEYMGEAGYDFVDQELRDKFRVGDRVHVRSRAMQQPLGYVGKYGKVLRICSSPPIDGTYVQGGYFVLIRVRLRGDERPWEFWPFELEHID